MEIHMTSSNDLPQPRLVYNARQLPRNKCGSLIDRGANGGIIGNDAHVIHVHERVVNVTGIDNHELNSLKIVDASAKIITQKGP